MEDKKNVKVGRAIRLMYGMLTDPNFSFDYFNRDQRLSAKKGGKKWKIMKAQLDYMMGTLLNNEIVIASGRSVGKCLHYNSITKMNDGTYKKLKELINRKFQIQTFNEKTNELYWTDAFAEDNGKKECFELTLDGNFKTEVTEEHPFLTNEGWKPIKELKPGDYIVQQEYTPSHSDIDDSPSDNELKLIGYLLGDGCITRSIKFTNIDSKIVNEIRIFAKEFNCRMKRSDKKIDRRGNYSLIRLNGLKNNIIELLREINLLGTNSHTKFIPDKYLKCSNKKLAILINRLFACDGWYSLNRIGYCTVSEKMMKQVQLILLRFGIRATYVEKQVKYNGGINIVYQMNIPSSSVRNFYEKIGIFTKLTDDNTIHLSGLEDRKKLIPLDDKLFNELKSQLAVSSAEHDKWQCRIRNTYDTIDVNKLKRYIGINNIDKLKYEHLWKNIVWTKIKSIKSIGKHSTVAVTVPETSTHIIDGILSHNTSSVEHMLFMIALTNPKKWSAYVVRNMRHATVLEHHLTEYFNKDSFSRQFYINYDKKSRVFSFTNGHKMEIRIVGHDKTGATTLVSGHYDYLFIDEAQLLPRAILNELIPAVKEGGQIVVTGVPNDIRDSVLYYYVSRYSKDNKDVMYYRYASYESEDWDDDKQARAIMLYGGKHTPAWRNLIEGKWGDHAASVFRPSKLVDGIIDNPFFRFKQYNGNSFEDAFRQFNLPILPPKYNYYIMGGDMGYTSNSPLHIVMLGAYKKKEKDEEVEHYDVIYRLEIENMAPYNIAKVINYLLDYFSCKHAAIDAQTVGHAVYDNLINQEIFPGSYIRNKMYMMPVIFTKPVIMSYIDTINQETGRDQQEEIKYAMKVAGTIKMIELVETERFHIALAETNADDYDDLVTIMIAETQSPSTKTLHPYTYVNSVNEHCVDALRCCALVIQLVVEKGLFRGGYGSVARPKKLTNTVFNRRSKTEPRRRRR